MAQRITDKGGRKKTSFGLKFLIILVIGLVLGKAYFKFNPKNRKKLTAN